MSLAVREADPPQDVDYQQISRYVSWHNVDKYKCNQLILYLVFNYCYHR